MFAWDDQAMSRGLWAKIVESNDMLILVDQLGREGTSSYLAKDTVFHYFVTFWGSGLNKAIDGNSHAGLRRIFVRLQGVEPTHNQLY